MSSFSRRKWPAFAEVCDSVRFMKTIWAATSDAVARGVVRPAVLVGVVAQVDHELLVGDLDRHRVDLPAVLRLLQGERALRQVLRASASRPASP